MDHTSDNNKLKTENLRDINRDKWQKKENIDAIQSKIKENKVLQKIEKVNRLIKESTTRNKIDSQVSNTIIEKVDWDSIYQTATNIMEEYTKNVDDIIFKLNQLNRVCMTSLHEKPFS